MRKRLTKHPNRVSTRRIQITNDLFVIINGIFFPLFQIDNDVQKSTTTKSSEDESSNDDTEEEDSLGKVLTKAGKEIDRKSAGNVRRSKEEAKADEEPENEFGYTDSSYWFFFKL